MATKREEILETLRAAALGEQAYDDQPTHDVGVVSRALNPERSMRRLVDAVSAQIAGLDERTHAIESIPSVATELRPYGDKPPRPPAPQTPTASPWETRFPRTELPPGTRVGCDVATRDGYLVPETTLRAASMGFVPRPVAPQPPAPAPAGDAGAYVGTELENAIAGMHLDTLPSSVDPESASVGEYVLDAARLDQLAARRADREEIAALKREVDQVTNQREFWKAASERYKTEADSNAQAARELAELAEVYRGCGHRIEGSAACEDDCGECAHVRELLHLDPEGTP